jgi:putative peptidoglycan lipid II flippase
VVGALGQVVIQLPGIWRQTTSPYRLTVNWESANTREILRLLGPRVVGLAAFQAMLFITLFLASGLPTGMVAAINYAWPLIMFPIGALGTAAATAIFPTLSRMTALEDLNAVRLTVNRSLRLIIFLALPSAVGLMVVREPIVNLLYSHNAARWTPLSTDQTAFALLFYAIAIAPLAVIEVLPRVFYAMKDTVTPVRIAIAAVTLDAILSIVLVHVLPPASGQGGLALATAIASTVQAIWLALTLNSALESIGLRALLLTVRDAALASFAMALVLYVVLVPLTAVLVQSGWGALITVVVEVGLGVGTFGLASYVIGAPELWEVRGFVTRMR